MKIVISFLVGILVAVLAVWALSHPTETKQRLESAGNKIEDGAREAKDKIADAADSIDTEGLKQELRDAGRAVKEVSSDALISTRIKAKLAAADTLSALRIDVDTTDGLVTLSGKVQSGAEKERAVSIARSVEGVKQVISTLQIERKPQGDAQLDGN